MRHHVGTRLGGLAGACAVVVTLALSGGVAQATLTITEVGPFGTQGTGAGQFEEPRGAAVNQLTGEVYVADKGNTAGSAGNRVDQLSASGSPLGEIVGTEVPGITRAKWFTPYGVAVNSSSGDVWVLNGYLGKESVDEFNSADKYVAGSQITGASLEGTPAAAQESTFKPFGVAVDPANGDLYVVDYGNGYVDVFNEAGVYQSQLGEGKGSGLGQFEELRGEETAPAIDSSGDVYVVDTVNHRVKKFTPSGATYTPSTFFTGSAPEAEPKAVAVDTETDDVYIGVKGSNTYTIEVYEPDGSLLTTFALPSGAASQETFGLAIDTKSGEIYAVLTEAHEVDVLSQGPGKCEPEPVVTSSGAASLITATGATLTGQLNPEGCASATYDFAYGTTTAYGESAPFPPASAPTGSTPESVSSVLSGLTPNTTYHFRLVVHSGAFTAEGSDVEFTTKHEAPVPVTQAASGVAQTIATLNATVNPEHTATTYSFQYGTTTAYGQEAPLTAVSAGEGTTPQAVTAAISGLQPDTTYHYRVLATNSVGETADGADQSFATTPVPAPSTGSAGPISQTSATLQGLLDPAGLESTYEFQYGTTTAYGLATAPQGAGSGEGIERESANLTGLAPDTTYHYRLVITDIAGSTYGEDQTFTTYPEVLSAGPLAISIGLGGPQLTLPSTFPTLPATTPTPPATIKPPSTPTTTKPKPKALTKAQKLKQALKQCEKGRAKTTRAKCEAAARKRYGPAKHKQAGAKRKASKKGASKKQ